MTKIEQIMTRDPIYLTQHANINKARMMMADKRIRHIPVKDPESGKLIGMVSQKAVLANAIKIINLRGLDQLEYTEKSADIGSIMEQSPAVFDINSELVDIANSLIEQRTGCVAIERDNELVGVVTSNDFVKFAVRELS